jgi:hypothetical protein
LTEASDLDVAGLGRLDQIVGSAEDGIAMLQRKEDSRRFGRLFPMGIKIAFVSLRIERDYPDAVRVEFFFHGSAGSLCVSVNSR